MNWRVTLLILLAFVGGVLVLSAIATRPLSAPEHEIYVNGNVLTMDTAGTVHEAVSLREGLIESVGSSEEMLALAGDNTVVVDLRGRSVLPGFIDAHGHFPGSGQTVFSADLNSPPIGEVTNLSQLLERLTRLAQARSDGWIIGHGYDDTLLAERRHPNRDDLDRVSSDRPVAIIHVSGHLAVVNSAALAILGIDAESLDPEGGVIVREPDSDGGRRPNGVLEETAARAVWEYTLDLSAMDALRMTTQAAEEYLAAGVTTASAGGDA